MSDDRLTDELAMHVMGWRTAPDRYLGSGRSWITKSRFRPCSDVHDAFRALEAAGATYSLNNLTESVFAAEVRVAGRVGRATGEPKARAISLALIRALDLDVDVSVSRTAKGNSSLGGLHGK